MNEIAFRPVAGFPGYWVGTDGSVWAERDGRRRWVRLTTSRGRRPQPYLTVVIRDGHGAKAPTRVRYVHRLVLEAFVGPCPEGWNCCHNDGDGTNNRLENLRWDTPRENAADTARHGRRWRGGAGRNHARGERAGAAKLTETQVREMRRLNAEGVSYRELGRRFGVSRAAATFACKGQTWHHVRTSLAALRAGGAL